MLTQAQPHSVSGYTGDLLDFETTCTTPTATVTKIVQHLNCRRIVCMRPTRTCDAGEPTRPEARPPSVFSTVTPEPGACVAVAQAIDNPGCNQCPTCLAAPVAQSTNITVRATPSPTVQV